MWSYHNPVQIVFGAGSFLELPRFVAGRRYALVTYGEAFFEGLAAKLAAIAGPPVLVIDDVAPNPDVVLLAEQSARLKGLPALPELIIALGGGSVIDSAKVYAAARGEFGAIRSYLEARAGADRLRPLPVIAVPTTAGTGSEVTSWGTVWDGAAGLKYSLALPGLYPEAAVIDPELMLGKPRELTLSTGLDALSHALESLWNKNANPVSMACAIAAAKEILESLPKLCLNLRDIDLRARMARASLLAGLAFSNTKTAIAHSLSYPITLRHGVPHGIACSFTLPMILRSMTGADGLCGEGLRTIFGSELEMAPSQLEAWFAALSVSTDVRAYGITPEEWWEIVQAALDGERGQNFIGSRDEFLAVAAIDGAAAIRMPAE